MNRSELDSILEKINYNIEFYENKKMDEKNRTYFLASGDSFNYSIPKKCIAHLLGINTTYLVSLGMFNNSNSFELLKEFTNNEYKVYRGITDGIIDPNKVFSKHIDIKLDSFKDNIKIMTSDIDFVSKYDSERTYESGSLQERFDYVIGKSTPNGEYMILGLVNNGYTTIPMSNQAFENYESAIPTIKRLISNQNITFVSFIKLANDNYNKANSVTINFKEKIEKYYRLSELRKEYGATIDVSRDYIRNLHYYSTTREKKTDNSKVIEKLISCISKGSIIDETALGIESFYEIDEELLKIIDTYNDSICTAKSPKGNLSYSAQRKELQEAKKQIQELQEKNTALINKNNELSTQNTTLQKENAENNNLIIKINELTKKRI